jgi:hypothetical protein
MDIETMISCFRETRLGDRMTAGLEGCERPGGDAGRGGRRSRCATESQPKQRARSDMVGNPVAKAAAWRRAEPGDLYAVRRIARRLATSESALSTASRYTLIACDPCLTSPPRLRGAAQRSRRNPGVIRR